MKINIVKCLKLQGKNGDDNQKEITKHPSVHVVVFDTEPFIGRNCVFLGDCNPVQVCNTNNTNNIIDRRENFNLLTSNGIFHVVIGPVFKALKNLNESVFTIKFDTTTCCDAV